MVKNKGKGGKNRRRGKADGDMKRELTFKEDGQGAAARACSNTPRRPDNPASSASVPTRLTRALSPLQSTRK